MRTSITLLFVWFGILLASAQEWNFAIGAGYSNTDTETKFVEHDADGNLYVAGEFSSQTLTIGVETIQNSGTTDVFIFKVSDGAIEWVTSLGGANGNRISNFGIGPDDKIYMGGWFSTAGFLFGGNPVSIDGSTVNYIQIDQSGTLIAIDADDVSNNPLFPSAFYCDPSGQIYISKTGTKNLLGIKQGERWTWNSYDVPIQSLTTRGGRIFAVSSFTGEKTINGITFKSRYDTEDLNCFGSADSTYKETLLLIETDSTGTIKQVKKNDLFTRADKIYISPMGELYVLARREYPLPCISIGPPVSYPYFTILKLDLNLDIQQSVVLQNEISDWDFDDEGNIYLSYYTKSYLPNIGIAKLNMNLGQIGCNTIPAIKDNFAYSVSADATGNVAVGGKYADAQLDLPPHTLTNTNDSMLVHIHPMDVYLRKHNMFVAQTGTDFSWNDDDIINLRAYFTYDVYANRTVQFESVYDGYATGYKWDFGDGSSSDEKIALHTYAQPGVYDVTLIVENSSYALQSIYKTSVLVSDGLLKSQTLSLAKGWNLVSLNVAPPSTKPADIFAPVHQSLETIKTVDSFYSPAIPEGLNRLQEIIPGNGYLVQMSHSADLTVYGTAVDLDGFIIDLSYGWNMVGIPLTQRQSVDEVFSAFPEEVTAIKDFDAYWLGSDLTGNLSDLEPGKAYFVEMKSAQKLKFSE